MFQQLPTDSVIHSDGDSLSMLSVGDSIAVQQSADTTSYQYILAGDTTGDATYSVGLVFDFTSIFNSGKSEEVAAMSPEGADSMMTSPVVYRPSIFAHHSLQPTHSELLPRQLPQSDAHVTISAAVLFVLMCIYYKVHDFGLYKVLASFSSQRSFDSLQRESNLTRRSSLTPCMILFAVTVAVYFIALRFFLQMPSLGVAEWQLLLAVAAASVMVFSLRNIAIGMLGRIFGGEDAVERYIIRGYLTQLLVASILLPLIFLLCFSSLSGPTCAVIISVPLALGFIYNLFNALRIFFLVPKVTNLFLFYYLCILEVVPILVIIKLYILL